MIEHMFLSGDARESEVERLEGEIAQVCGLLHATTARLVSLIAEVLATESWTGHGIRSAEHWVAWQCGVSASRAHRLVVMARRLAELPEAAAAFRAGELSEDQVAVVARHAPCTTTVRSPNWPATPPSRSGHERSGATRSSNRPLKNRSKSGGTSASGTSSPAGGGYEPICPPTRGP